MLVIATIRRTVVQDVPVTLTVTDPHQVVPEAINAANALQSGEAGSADLRATAVVRRIEEAGSGRCLFDNITQQAASRLAPGHFEVVWRAQIPAESAEHAACMARVMQADPASPMSVFEVTDANGRQQQLNLQDAGYFVH